MRIVFCGTPSFAVPSLLHLVGQPDFQIIGVITQPDRPRGRGQEVSFSPIKEAAMAAGIPVHQPEKIRDSGAQQLLRDMAPDAVAIVAYGQIIPARLLSIPKHGWINLHASLLPKFRGAAPINWAIVHGEMKTGVSTMRIDAGMDTGEILLQQEMEIQPKETSPELAKRMGEMGAPVLAETLRGLNAGLLSGRAQDHGEASYAPLLKKGDGKIDWKLPAREIFNRMRGFAPWPGTYSFFRGHICQLWGEPVSNDLAESVPGTLRLGDAGLLVACGDATVLRVLSVQLEGRKKISATEFANGSRLRPGEHFGEESLPESER